MLKICRLDGKFLASIAGASISGPIAAEDLPSGRQIFGNGHFPDTDRLDAAAPAPIAEKSWFTGAHFGWPASLQELTIGRTPTEPIMNSVVRALDIGYSNSKLTIDPDTRPYAKCMLIPSIAISGAQSQLSAALGAARRTITIAIDGLQYEVGHDARLAQGAAWSPNMSDDYCTTPEYLAIGRAALHYMASQVIDLLVLGLPVSTYRKRRHDLESRMIGLHVIGPREKVLVRDVKVVAQPCGALMYFLKYAERLDVRTQRNLVIDCGSRTFDWIVADGLQVRDELSGAVNRGMHDVLESIARGISDAEGVNFRDLDRIDSALRQGRNPLVFGKEYDIAPFLSQARKVTDEALLAVKKHVDQGSDIDNVIASGGAAYFYLPAIQAAFPRHKIHAIDEPVFANVRGFQIAGEAFVQHFGRRVRPDTERAA